MQNDITKALVMELTWHMMNVNFGCKLLRQIEFWVRAENYKGCWFLLFWEFQMFILNKNSMVWGNDIYIYNAFL